MTWGNLNLPEFGGVNLKGRQNSKCSRPKGAHSFTIFYVAITFLLFRITCFFYVSNP